MTTIKSNTDLPQSKKLAEFLPLESADMCWSEYDDGQIRVMPMELWDLIKDGLVCLEFTPAWSLAALLGIIPKHIKDYNVLRIDISENEFAIWYDKIGFGVNSNLPDITMESAVDACVSMIEKLHELKML